MADRWPDRRMRYYDLKHPNALPDEQRAARKQAERQRNAMLDKLGRPSASLTAANKSRLAHIHRFRTIDPIDDSLAYEELRAMGMNEYGAPQAVAAEARGEVGACSTVRDDTDTSLASWSCQPGALQHVRSGGGSPRHTG